MHTCFLFVSNYILLIISSRFYFILYEVESPLRLRFERFSSKYTNQEQRLQLEEFIELDDKIKFNTEEYSLYNTISE